jgi:hypothetical protein
MLGKALKPRSRVPSDSERIVEQALLDRILYIGNEIPTGVAIDPRDKFVLLGSPAELIRELAHDFDYKQLPELPKSQPLRRGQTFTFTETFTTRD